MDQKTKEALSKLILELVQGDKPEDEEDRLHSEIPKLSPDPEWSDYVFWSEDYYDSDGKLDIDAIVEKISSYKPIIL